MGTHYSKVFDINIMLAWAKREAFRIQKYAKESKLHPILVYSGMSGISHATHLALALFNKEAPFSQVYVRKDKEKSHGRRVEHDIYNSFTSGDFNDKECFIVFVDDFVDQFQTFFNIMKKFNCEHVGYCGNIYNINIMFSLYSYTTIRTIGIDSDKVIQFSEILDHLCIKESWMQQNPQEERADLLTSAVKVDCQNTCNKQLQEMIKQMDNTPSLEESACPQV